MKILHKNSGKIYTRAYHWQSTPMGMVEIDAGDHGFWANLEWLEPLDDEARDLFAAVRSGKKPDRERMIEVRRRQ